MRLMNAKAKSLSLFAALALSGCVGNSALYNPTVLRSATAATALAVDAAKPADTTPTATTSDAPLASAATVGAVPDLDIADFVDGDMKSFKNAHGALPRVAIGGFRVAFVTKAVASDRIRSSYMPGGLHSSGVNSKLELTLRNIDNARLQAITDAAYADFIAALKAAGVDVIPYEQVSAYSEFAGMDFAASGTAQPFVKEHEGRSYAILSPTGTKLWFDQAEPLGDQGAFGWGNRRKIGGFGFEQKALIINPLLVVDFAETWDGKPKGFFNLRLSDSTTVGAKTGISLSPGMGKTGLAYVARTAPIATTAIGAALPLKEAVAFGGKFGTMAQVDKSSNRGVIVALGALGLNGGPVRTMEKNELSADPDAYQALAMQALRTGNRLFSKLLSGS